MTEPALLDPLGGAPIGELAAALRGGAAPAVIVIDCDPVYTAPRGLGLDALVRTAAFSLHVGAYRDETAAACTVTMPLAHELETWTDPRAWDGTLAIGQPAIRPRFAVASAIDVLAALAGDDRDARTLVREAARGVLPTEAAWTQALRDGVVAGTQAAAIDVAPVWPADAAAELERVIATPAAPIEIALAASPAVHDGRFAGNAWLQELPHPVTKQTWGNAALISAATARRLAIADGAPVRVATAAGAIALPAIIVAGAADDQVTVELGHGRAVPAIPIADRVGADAYALRTDDARILAGTVAPAPGADVRPPARTQHTFTEHDRDVAPAATLAAYLRDADLVTGRLRGDLPTLLPARDHTGVQWGMSIDTTRCTGCSACMVACQAENNIPTVGADEVARGRHMSWIRVDRYIRTDGIAVNQPVPCQHCEDAPCEYVCPVGATEHSPDGLNEQVYNRCVGTRFCANNCPYKVRRFNWFAYEQPAPRALQYNPEVTVRSRGVMEKCTYCVQRIRGAEHRALVEHRALAVGDVATACQAACPTQAITFGQLAETDTAFAAARRDPRRYDLMHDLGTRPRTQYLAVIKNPKDAP